MFWYTNLKLCNTTGYTYDMTVDFGMDR